MAALMLVSTVKADATATPTPTPQQSIADSLCQVVNLVKYVAGAIAILALTMLGVQFMTVGSNPMAREDIKTKMVYVVAGMLVILMSGYIVAIFLPQAASCPLI